jgi:hypothetical protein
MLHWKQLVKLPEEELSRLDVAAVNLARAADLPGAERIDHGRCLGRLDEWAERVRQYTDRLMPQFQRKPHEYQDSESYFRALCMVTVLQRDLGLRYNPDKIPEDAPLDTADVFIHGAVLGNGGTCGSLPVVYVAVGRRLGYPLTLVSARREPWGHSFARWDDPKGERFNIEATNQGLNVFPDDYYRTGGYEITPEQEQKGCLLRSKTARQELAGFLAERGFGWLDVGRQRKAVEALGWAFALHPENRMYWNTFSKKLDDWRAELQRLEPPGFPALYLTCPLRRYPETMPFAAERDIIGIEVAENLLKDPELERKWWGPLRRGERLAETPSRAIVTCMADGGCQVVLQTSKTPVSRSSLRNTDV